MERRAVSLLDWLDQADRRVVAAACVLVAVVLEIIDAVTGPWVPLSLLYLLPIGVGAWWVAGAFGTALSVAGAIAWTLEDRSILPPDRPGLLAWNFIVKLGLFLAVSVTLTLLRRALARQRALARTDALTGAYNRRSFFETAGLELERSGRTGRPLTLAYFDIDDFKRLNDEFGHLVGDDVLRTVAATVRAQTRANDILARIGGDEFALLLVEADFEQAAAALAKLRDRLNAAMRDRGWRVTVSLGAVTYEALPESVDELLAIADATMYQVKALGKNAIRHARSEVVRPGPAPTPP